MVITNSLLASSMINFPKESIVVFEELRQMKEMLKLTIMLGDIYINGKEGMKKI